MNELGAFQLAEACRWTTLEAQTFAALYKIHLTKHCAVQKVITLSPHEWANTILASMHGSRPPVHEVTSSRPTFGSIEQTLMKMHERNCSPCGVEKRLMRKILFSCTSCSFSTSMAARTVLPDSVKGGPHEDDLAERRRNGKSFSTSMYIEQGCVCAE